MEDKDSTGKRPFKESKFFLPAVLLAGLVVMFVCCLFVFFNAVKGEEQVLVPNLVGKDLKAAMLEMQERELYPRIQLRYTDSADDENVILSQEPLPGAISKAGRRILLTVSRGVILDHIENYIGKNFESEKIRLQALFAGAGKQLVTFAEPVYKTDNSEAGTILSQEPPEGTEISQPVTVKFVVSRGPSFEQVKVPSIVGMSISEILSIMEKTKVTFEFSAHTAIEGEKPGTVTNQQTIETGFVRNYARVNADFAFPENNIDANGMIYGIFEHRVQEYPFPVLVELIADVGGDSRRILRMNHIGGRITIPYSVPAESTLRLLVAEREVAKVSLE